MRYTNSGPSRVHFLFAIALMALVLSAPVFGYIGQDVPTTLSYNGAINLIQSNDVPQAIQQSIEDSPYFTMVPEDGEIDVIISLNGESTYEQNRETRETSSGGTSTTFSFGYRYRTFAEIEIRSGDELLRSGSLIGFSGSLEANEARAIEKAARSLAARVDRFFSSVVHPVDAYASRSVVIPLYGEENVFVGTFFDIGDEDAGALLQVTGFVDGADGGSARATVLHRWGTPGTRYAVSDPDTELISFQRGTHNVLGVIAETAGTFDVLLGASLPVGTGEAALAIDADSLSVLSIGLEFGAGGTLFAFDESTWRVGGVGIIRPFRTPFLNAGLRVGGYYQSYRGVSDDNDVAANGAAIGLSAGVQARFALLRRVLALVIADFNYPVGVFPWTTNAGAASTFATEPDDRFGPGVRILAGISLLNM